MVPNSDLITNRIEETCYDMLTTRLGLQINQNDFPTGGISLPDIFDHRLQQIDRVFCRCGFRTKVYAGTTPGGLRLIAVGDSRRSRLVAMHPDDHSGILYLVSDDGRDPDLTQIEVRKAIWLGDMISNSPTSVQNALNLDGHANERLRLKKGAACY